MTPSQVRNAIRRGLHELLDRSLSNWEKHRLWEFFESSCAYCGLKLIRSERKGHVDHLVSRANAGTNGLANCVLACSTCNGDEKRDESWETFLLRKCADETTLRMRRSRIEQWVAKNASASSGVSKDFIEQEIARVLSEFDSACAAIRGRLSR